MPLLSLQQHAKAGKKRRGSLKKKGAEEDWLAELHACHSAVGGCFGVAETAEDRAFFARAKRTEKEVELLGKEIEVSEDAGGLPTLPASR